MSKKFYASEKIQEVSTNDPTAEANLVTVWSSKEARDNYIVQSSNISASAILRAEVIGKASHGCNAPMPKGKKWCIIHHDDAIRFPKLADELPDAAKGYIGSIGISDPAENWVVSTL